jgi:hypothetical protein
MAFSDKGPVYHRRRQSACGKDQGQDVPFKPSLDQQGRSCEHGEADGDMQDQKKMDTPLHPEQVPFLPVNRIEFMDEEKRPIGAVYPEKRIFRHGGSFLISIKF